MDVRVHAVADGHHGTVPVVACASPWSKPAVGRCAYVAAYVARAPPVSLCGWPLSGEKRFGKNFWN